MDYLSKARSVGRPKKEARDAAIFIARKWLVEHSKVSVALADAWIIQHWADHTPKGQRAGITDPAHVRAALRRARNTWLQRCELSFNDSLRVTSSSIQLVAERPSDWLPQESLGADFEMDGCAIAAFEFVIHGSARGWVWMKGMTDAQPLKRVKIHDQGRLPAMGLTPSCRDGFTQVATGVGEFVGVLQLRTLKRFHQRRDRWRFG